MQSGFPERVQVLVQAYKKAFEEEAHRHRAVRASANIKKGSGNHGFDEMQEQVKDNDFGGDSSCAASKRPQSVAPIGETPPYKRVRAEGVPFASPDKDGDVGIARLRSYETWWDTCRLRVQPVLKEAAGKVDFRVGGRRIGGQHI